MIDLDELERKAKAASAKDALSFDEEDFSAYITPEIVCELINRLREAERDAARYRWLRHEIPSVVNAINNLEENEWDAAIDAAIAKEQGNG